jgi:uncharacterized protein YceK
MKMHSLNAMNTGRLIKALIMLIAFGILFTGCASQTKTMPKSGFLTDYSLLKIAEGEDTQWPSEWTYVKEGVDWKSYDKIMIDLVTYFFNDESKYKGIQAEDLAAVGALFNEQLTDAFEKDYTITDKPGPNTLRIRTAVTDLQANKPVIGTVTTIVPVGLGLSHIKKVTSGTHIGMAEANGEAELLDSQTGEVLVAGISLGATGKKYRIDKTVTKWGQVEVITKMWAEQAASRAKYLINK